MIFHSLPTKNGDLNHSYVNVYQRTDAIREPQMNPQQFQKDLALKMSFVKENGPQVSGQIITTSRIDLTIDDG